VSAPATTITAPEAVAAVAAHHHGGSYVTTSLQTARRSLLQFFRTPQVLVMGTVQGALFLFMFRYVFGGAISTGGPISYVDAIRMPSNPSGSRSWSCTTRSYVLPVTASISTLSTQ